VLIVICCMCAVGKRSAPIPVMVEEMDFDDGEVSFWHSVLWWTSSIYYSFIIQSRAIRFIAVDIMHPSVQEFWFHFRCMMRIVL